MKSLILVLTIALSPSLLLANTPKCGNSFIDYEGNRYYDVLDYSKFTIPDAVKAVEAEIQMSKMLIERIKKQKEEPTFENTILELEKPVSLLSGVADSFLETMELSNASKATSEASKLTSKMNSDFGISVATDKVLFERVKYVQENTNKNKLNTEEKLLLKSTYEFFLSSGIHLDRKGQKKLAKLNEEIKDITTQYQENLMNFEAETFLSFSREQLEGLSERSFEKLDFDSTSNTYKVYANGPTSLLISKSVKSSEVREQVSKMNSKKGEDKKYNNTPLTIQFVEKMKQKSELLGFKTTAHSSLSEKMVKEPAKIIKFIDVLVEASLEQAKRELAELTAFARENGFKAKKLNPWDLNYYEEMYLKKNLKINEEKISEYFEIENVIKELLKFTEKLYGIEFAIRPDIESFHKDSFTYAILKEGRPLGSITFDMFLRKKKKNGAWMVDMAHSWIDGGMRVLPAASVNMNVVKAKKGPKLLTYDEVVTLFHEMGHALHGTIGTTRFKSQFGVRVPWDFVETPSQLMEEFVLATEVINKIGKHYKTGKVISQKDIDKIQALAKFNGAMGMIRQLKFSKIDFAYFHQGLNGETNLVKFENEATKGLNILSEPKSAMGPVFSHIMGGGYTAGYHSYKWAEVMSADIASKLIVDGKIDYKMAKRWHDLLLSKGSSVDLETNIKDLLGREVDISPLLRRNGIEH